MCGFVMAMCLTSGRLACAAEPLAVATTTTDSSGRVTLVVQNFGTSALTACVYIAAIHTTSARTGPATIEEHGLRDAAVNFFENPIMPNQSGTFSISGFNGQVSFLAALWADGTSFGDPMWIAKISTRRKLALKHIDLLLSIVEDARRTNSSLLDTAARANASAKLVLQDSSDPDVFAGVNMYYTAVNARLTGPTLKRNGVTPLTDEETMGQAIRELEMYRRRLALYD